MSKDDYLDRKKDVKNICTIIDHYKNRKNKSNISFAINGKWGCGKTFVLEMVKNELESTPKFSDCIIFNYNCWQYDYYEEPLFAIVSVMYNSIKSNSNIKNPEKEDVLKSLKDIVIFVLTAISAKKSGIFNAYLQNKGATKGSESQPDYEQLFTFNEKLEDLRKKIKAITQKQNRTIVFIVDELDRCLPEYAIKVLERLHHISYGISNFITIIAVDEEGMLNSIKNVFGYNGINGDAVSKKFFEKFVQFSFTLNSGSPSKYSKKYGNYAQQFIRYNENDFNKYITVLFKSLFNNTVIRDQEVIFEKAFTVHKLSNEGNKSYDYSVMYMELLLTTFFLGSNNNNDLINIIDNIISYKGIDYDKDASGLDIIKDNIWHILKWYAAFLFAQNSDESWNFNADRFNNLSRKTAHISGVDLESCIEFLHKFHGNLTCFK